MCLNHFKTYYMYIIFSLPNTKPAFISVSLCFNCTLNGSASGILNRFFWDPLLHLISTFLESTDSFILCWEPLLNPVLDVFPWELDFLSPESTDSMLDSTSLSALTDCHPDSMPFIMSEPSDMVSLWRSKAASFPSEAFECKNNILYVSALH